MRVVDLSFLPMQLITTLPIRSCPWFAAIVTVTHGGWSDMQPAANIATRSKRATVAAMLPEGKVTAKPTKGGASAESDPTTAAAATLCTPLSASGQHFYIVLLATIVHTPRGPPL